MPRMPVPDYQKMFAWDNYSSELSVEYRQSTEEGKDLAHLKALFEAAAQMENSPEKDRIADVLYTLQMNAKTLPGYAYKEPDELDEIRKLMPECSRTPRALPDRDTLFDRVYGAWLGRVAGCLLGKPIEGIRTNELHPLLKESGNWPLHRYILSADLTEEMYKKYTFRLKGRCFADTISFAPYDDDTNYTVLGQMLIERFGRNFTSENVAQIWQDLQPKQAYCTAERAAFRNFVNGYLPHDSAIYKNPYREWIGAQIRADYFGYINPGDPDLAAEMAWRDARISHVKNGIYGEMFAAAMIAEAAVNDDLEEILVSGLSRIPETSRLYEAVSGILSDYKNGKSAFDAFSGIHARWNEHDAHDWCHTISNAEIVAAALLYGKGDFGASVCLAVQTGFDTDCNGATVGSVLGMRSGAGSIGENWTKPFHGMLETTVFGVGKISIREAAEKTMRHMA